MRWLSRLAWLPALWLAAGCEPAQPARPPEVEVPTTPAPEPPAAAPAGNNEAAPVGYIPMQVGFVSEDGDEPYVVLEGAAGSFLTFRPEAGPELAETAAAVPFVVSREARRLVAELRAGRPSPEAREPFDRWSRELLATGAVFLRAEFSLRRDLQADEIPAGGIGKLSLLVRRGGRVEAVDAGDDAVPVILLHEIPLFVEIDLLRQIGGMKTEE